MISHVLNFLVIQPTINIHISLILNYTIIKVQLITDYVHIVNYTHILTRRENKEKEKKKNINRWIDLKIT